MIGRGPADDNFDDSACDMTMIVVYNPSSGSSRPLTELKELFSSNGVSVERFATVDDDLSDFIKQNKTLAVIGGDGTISSIAEKVVGTKAREMRAEIHAGNSHKHS